MYRFSEGGLNIARLLYSAIEAVLHFLTVNLLTSENFGGENGTCQIGKTLNFGRFHVALTKVATI